MKKIIIALVIITVISVFFTINFKRVVVPGPIEVLPDPLVLVLEIRQLFRLETACLTLEKIVRGTRDNDRLGGVFGETILFVAVGQVVAGVDFDKLTDSDIEVISSDTVKVRLPQAEIFYVVIDNQKSYVAYRDKGVLAHFNFKLETVIRDKAQESLKKNAIESDIFNIANINAQENIRKLLEKFGLKKIEFI